MKTEKLTAVEWLFYRMIMDKTLSEKADFMHEAKEMEKEQHQETWETAHQAGRFEGKGIAEENWQTFEPYWEENFKSE